MKIRNHKGEIIEANYIFDKFFAVTCGEAGRGRKLGFVGLDRLLQKKGKLDGNYSVIKTDRGNWLIKEGTEKGIILVTQWYGGFRGSISDNISELEAARKIEILAQGETAEGNAGRMGGEYQYILLVKENCRIEYSKHGRLYGDARDWVIEIDIENETVNNFSKESDVDLDG